MRANSCPQPGWISKPFVSRPEPGANSPASVRAHGVQGQKESVANTSPAPLVSAIVSAYNCERFMRGCLEDLTGQTLFASGQLEIIVVDTASPQNERAIVQEFQKNFPNIIYLRTEQRETIYAAWNRGVQAARGRYLTSANSDDRHRPDGLAVMAAYLEEHPEIALVYANQLVSEVPNETFAQTQATSRWDWPQYSYAELERRCIVGPSLYGAARCMRSMVCSCQNCIRREIMNFGCASARKRVSTGCRRYWAFIITIPTVRNTVEATRPGKLMKSVSVTASWRGIWKHSAAFLFPFPWSSSINCLSGPLPRRVLPRRGSIQPSPITATRRFRRCVRRARTCPTDPGAPPLVTIITPFFNTGDIFEQTAQSVIGQTFQQWEWLIVNDASTAPEAQRVLSRYRQADPRIKVIDQSANAGPGAARNRAVKMACGDYIVLLDSDDLLEPTAVEKWLWHLESHPEYAFVKGFSVGFGAKNYLWSNGFHNREAFLKENLADLTSLIRKSTFATVGGFAEEMRHGFEDWEFWLRCASHGLWGATVPEHLDWYRRRDNHNDRWSNWDGDTLQRKARAELQREIPGGSIVLLLHPDRVPSRLDAPVNLDAPSPKSTPQKHGTRNTQHATYRPKPPPENQPASPLLILPWMTMGGADSLTSMSRASPLTGRGWEVTCATTLQGDHSWMPQFNRFTPDIFAMPHFLEIADYPRCSVLSDRIPPDRHGADFPLDDGLSTAPFPALPVSRSHVSGLLPHRTGGLAGRRVSENSRCETPPAWI